MAGSGVGVQRPPKRHLFASKQARDEIGGLNFVRAHEGGRGIGGDVSMWAPAGYVKIPNYLSSESTIVTFSGAFNVPV